MDNIAMILASDISSYNDCNSNTYISRNNEVRIDFIKSKSSNIFINTSLFTIIFLDPITKIKIVEIMTDINEIYKLLDNLQIYSYSNLDPLYMILKDYNPYNTIGINYMIELNKDNFILYRISKNPNNKTVTIRFKIDEIYLERLYNVIRYTFL